MHALAIFDPVRILLIVILAYLAYIDFRTFRLPDAITIPAKRTDRIQFFQTP